MKKFILLFALVLFSFSLESSTTTQGLVLNQPTHLTTFLHYTHTVFGVKQYITLTLDEKGTIGHYNHINDCLPPCRP